MHNVNHTRRVQLQWCTHAERKLDWLQSLKQFFINHTLMKNCLKDWSQSKCIYEVKCMQLYVRNICKRIVNTTNAGQAFLQQLLRLAVVYIICLSP